jgi:hypothetical protein
MVLCSTLPRLARGYVNAMQGWLRNTELLKPQVLALRYEDLLSDFPGHAQQLADFIGVADCAPMLRFHDHARAKGYIATPSYAQVTEPANTRAIGRWLRYRNYLDAALPILQPMLEHWGYAG